MPNECDSNQISHVAVKPPPFWRHNPALCTDIRHVSGSDNSVADALSRINALNLSTTDLQHLADSQTKDEELKTLISSNDLSIKLKPLKMGKMLLKSSVMSVEKKYDFMCQRNFALKYFALSITSPIQAFVPRSASSKTASSGRPC
ncbi:hypothetical protein TNCV_4563471 [Trichonephila clavipes]|uniref:Uncharacterized protein n=1 Tax=Trichonephila clavipes TaxID=2585209 RepID=A0A8X7BET2_TRICX|nr:hypothetical protein TNCV_4563471 [Trichonephila clavipes]